MLFSELYKIMVKKVTFVGFRGATPQSPPLDPPLFITDSRSTSSGLVLVGHKNTKNVLQPSTEEALIGVGRQYQKRANIETAQQRTLQSLIVIQKRYINEKKTKTLQSMRLEMNTWKG